MRAGRRSRSRASAPGAAAAPLAKVTDGDDSDGLMTVRVRLRAARGVQSTPVSARAAEILRGLREGSTGQFHEKIGASFYHPNRQNPAVSCLMFFSPVCGARRRHHSTNGVLDNGHVECVEACAFFRGPNKSKIAPKWGFEPIFSSHRGSILSRRAWRVAPAAA